MKCKTSLGWRTPKVRLFHSKEKFERYIANHGIEMKALDDCDAQAFFLGGLNGNRSIGVVLIEAFGDWHSDAAMLVHEATHIARDWCDHMEIEDEEVLAYVVQDVSEALFRAHERWKRKHGMVE